MAKARPSYGAKLVRTPKGVQGFDELMINLNKELQKVIKVGNVRGLALAMDKIRRGTEEAYPITPVDIGNLISSWFSVSAKGVGSDPLGKSGDFKDNPKTGLTASQLKGEHSAIIAASQAEVNSSKNPLAIGGYSANYALFVHENLESDKPWSRPLSGPKWFEAAVKRNVKNIFEIVKNNSKIP